MHRFRKKSDAKRSDVPSAALVRPGDHLPTLPPASDFRTSLILPDLTRRFTLLRSSSGNLVSLDDMKSRFAEQRALGSGNAISEEEEDMLIEALSRIHAQNARPRTAGDDGRPYQKQQPSSAPYTVSEFSHSAIRQSAHSVVTSSSSTGHDSADRSASPGSRTSKRHSNNLFGSGQFRDLRYIRRASNRNGSSRSVLSVTPSEATSGSGANASVYASADNLRPTTPENSTASLSPASSPVEKTPVMRSAPLQPPTPFEEQQSVNVTELRFAKGLTRTQLKRMSASLEEVIRELEEEAEDEVLLPRTTPSHHVVADQLTPTTSGSTGESNNNSPTTNESEETTEATNWIADDSDIISDYRSTSPYPSRGTVSPVPRVPGYIPGMPRPMTPRETDSDDQRSYSTTPRATSPTYVYDRSAAISPINATGIFRRGSNASTARQTPRSGSPLAHATQRNGNGRYTPEERHRNGDANTELVQPAEPVVGTRRRPASPLAATAYQAMPSSSRPSTPSNVTWNVPAISTTQAPKQLGRNGNISVHSREASANTIADSYESAQSFMLERSKSLTRSLRSPPLPDSPLIDSGHTSSTDNKGFNQHGASSPIPGLELGSPTLTPNRDVRSPVPIQGSPSPLISNPDTSYINQKASSRPITPSTSPFTSQFHNALIVSANSSRSSLVSAGSSYHSWNEEHASEGLGIGILGDLDEKIPAWHDFPPDDKSNSHPNDVANDQSLQDPEAILRHFTGLTKGDLAAIQTKLFDATQKRPKNTESRSSTLRRRRPSTAQSIHSAGGRESRTTSPAPQSPIAPSFGNAMDNKAKANALLNSVVDSISGPLHMDSNPSSPADEDKAEAVSPTRTDLSSPSRRNKDLADVLFGTSSADPPSVSENPKPSDHTSPPPVSDLTAKSPNLRSRPLVDTPQAEASVTARVQTAPSDIPLKSPVASSPVDQAQLMKQVQERADAANAQLRKSPSQQRFPTHTAAPRKRINVRDISGPLSVQSSTSVNVIAPVQSPPVASVASPTVSDQRQSSSKITSRMRRLRDTLRAKTQTLNGDEVTPWTADSGSFELSRSLRDDPQKRSPPAAASLSSSTHTPELGRFRPADPSPPASAGPSLKSFMSRFRRRGQTDPSPENERRNAPVISRSPALPLSPALFSSTSTERRDISPPYSAPATSNAGYTLAYQVDAPSRPLTPSRTPTLSRSGTLQSRAAGSPDQAALKQFFDAAENLGLDQAALNDFVTRSQSTETPYPPAWTSRTADLTRHDSTGGASKMGSRENHTSDRARSPISDAQSMRTPEPARAPSLRTAADQVHIRRPRETPEGQVAAVNSVVRRTLIFASENGSNTDLATLLRKASKKGRRASGTSVHSGRSVHDRAPTPPPPPRAKRFSADPSPPVPRLPLPYSSQNQGGMLLPETIREAQPEKSSSTYDSLYEMYAGGRAGSSHGPETAEPFRNSSVDNIPGGESSKAVEVIEMANGETIWSIINGLRDDDLESVYPSRISMASEFSVASPDGEVEQLFFKEHLRNSSKGSNTSFLSRKKTATGPNRPETKVFYSSSTQIARLIEQLSRTADAGSFNIKPKGPVGHSHSSSIQSETDMHWTVEERLEHMLGSMNAST